MGNKVYFLLVITIYSFTAVTAQVGISTTAPQAKLDVDGGNVRFSEYGTNLHLGTPEYLLGVEADGDIVEVPPREENRGLQFYTWHPFDDISNTNGTPGINVVDTRNLTTFVRANGNVVGVPVLSGLYTGPLFLTHNGNGGSVDLDGDAPHPEMRPAGDHFIIVYKGTLDVVETGLFTISSNSRDGSRMIVDDVIVINDWIVQGTANTTVSSTITLTKGKHEVEFWYFESGGGDQILFRWEPNPDGSANPNGYTGDILATQFLIE